MSLPLRERGLKSMVATKVWAIVLTSLPLRERGLKSTLVLGSSLVICVAPLAGAWIEISPRSTPELKACVSLPLRERGLK